MTEEQKDCGLTKTDDTNPQSDIEDPTPDNEAVAPPQGREESPLQAQTVPFEEDVAPPARAEEIVQEDPVGCAPHTISTDEKPEDTEGLVAPPPSGVVLSPTQPGAAGPHPDNPQSEIPNPPSETPTVESVIEAILFATDEPLTDSKLAGIVETTAKQVRESIENLNAQYGANNSAFRIESIAGGYQMLTLNLYNPWLKKMLRARSDNKLSPAAMETLAIIAYKQPIIRADIEAIRGVAVGEVIRSLMYKSLVKITGRAEVLGRPMLYGTTKKFLEIFGLNSLKDLPKAEELKNPDRQ